MKRPKLLLAEDEGALGVIIAESLETRGFEVVHVRDGAEAWQTLKAAIFDLAILDVMMPRLDGFTLVKKIRLEYPHLPVLFLTGKTMTRDVVEGFESGGNDYLKKPFAMEELVVRVKSLLHHSPSKPRDHSPVLSIGAYRLHVHRQELVFQERIRRLTARETDILKLLCDYNQSVLDKKTLLSTLWGEESFFTARTLDVFITRLRKYLSDDPEVRIINIRGIGYKLVW